jgi:hypothetical protein
MSATGSPYREQAISKLKLTIRRLVLWFVAVGIALVPTMVIVDLLTQTAGDDRSFHPELIPSFAAHYDYTRALTLFIPLVVIFYVANRLTKPLLPNVPANQDQEIVQATADGN